VPTKPAAYIKHTFTVDDINPHLPAEEAAALKARLLAADNNGIFAPITTKDTVSVPASNGGTLFAGAAAEPRTGAVYVVAHDNPGIVRLLRPGEGRAFGVPPGQAVYQQNCQACHGVNRQGTDTGVALVHATADAPNNVAAGAPRFDGAAIRAVLATGKNRMPPFPHLSAADVDNLVSLLTVAIGGRARGPFPGRGSSVASGAPPELIAGAGSAWVRPDAPGLRGRGPVPYPEGTPDYTRYTINEYHTVANGIRPPFTTIVKFDLNAPAIAWRIPFGDDPALAARGITGTGAPATNNGIILTASGLVFGAGLDNHLRAWDTDSGRELWSTRFGGNFTGSPVMYAMSGKQYLLVAAASTPPARRGVPEPAPPAGPMGWVAYALP
jgi:quinoprotein glucose dehydrogenase